MNGGGRLHIACGVCFLFLSRDGVWLAERFGFAEKGKRCAGACLKGGVCVCVCVGVCVGGCRVENFKVDVEKGCILYIPFLEGCCFRAWKEGRDALPVRPSVRPSIKSINQSVGWNQKCNRILPWGGFFFSFDAPSFSLPTSYDNPGETPT